MLTITPKSSPEQVLREMDMQARTDPARPETTFVKGRSLFLTREEGMTVGALVSLESSTYQGMMYRVSSCVVSLAWVQAKRVCVV
jgi:hypothetical protein